MTSFVESCIATSANSAHKVARATRGRPSATKLIKLLSDKPRVLITTHMHPDPDAVATCTALRALIKHVLPKTEVVVSIKGQFGGGLNQGFARLSNLQLDPWDDDLLPSFDAIILCDVQPSFAYSPLPPTITPLAVIDHHSARGRKPKVPFCDIRTDVGAAASIAFNYLMELEVPIDATLAATLLYAIESDLAGAAGQPGELDNIALSSLTLRADPRKLNEMRYAPLPAEFFSTMHRGLSEAMIAAPLLVTFLGSVNTPEMPAVIADYLLRLDSVDWVLVSAIYSGKLVLSLRTRSKQSAGEMMKHLSRKIGDGGGHRTKAGGYVVLENASAAEIERVRKTLRQRLIKLLNLPKDVRFQKLVTPQI